jgi:hypothetical protein
MRRRTERRRGVKLQQKKPNARAQSKDFCKPMMQGKKRVRVQRVRVQRVRVRVQRVRVQRVRVQRVRVQRVRVQRVRVQRVRVTAAVPAMALAP